jgi:pimeloyl-ACP methyl ester carboxylesterase
MTLGSKRRRAHDKLAALPGVRSVRRPVTTAAAELFDLFYVRTGERSAPPLVIIPGGPGVASIGHYRGLRRRATAAGLDVIMVEHRGVGMSRHDDAGADLPPAALTVEQVVDDIAAVLDDADVHRAVIYGTSYGSYLAAGLGVRHPGRVHAMVLDSPLLNHEDIETLRQVLRGMFWHGDDQRTADLAVKVRRLADRGAMTPADARIAADIYSLGGAALLNRQLDLLLDDRRLFFSAIGRLGQGMADRKVPYRNETDLVGPIGYRELNFGGIPDGLPLDPAIAAREFAAEELPPFEAEPFDLIAAMPGFTWPTAIISGGRDLTTPPAIAERIAELVPAAVMVRLPTAGHSVLDTRETAAVRIAAAVCSDAAADLAGRGVALDEVPARPAMRAVGAAVEAAVRIEAVLPRFAQPRSVRRAIS